MYGLFLVNKEGAEAETAYATAERALTLVKVAEDLGFTSWCVRHIETRRVVIFTTGTAKPAA